MRILSGELSLAPQPWGQLDFGSKLKQSRNKIHEFTINNWFSFYDIYFLSKNILDNEICTNQFKYTTIIEMFLTDQQTRMKFLQNNQMI